MNRQSASVLFASVIAFAFLVATLAAQATKPSRTTFASSARQVTAGQGVTMQAAVSPLAAADGVPTGSVEFFDGATSLGSVDLAQSEAGSQATLTVSTLSVGPHPITARYSGDSQFRGSVSVPEMLLVVAGQ